MATAEVELAAAEAAEEPKRAGVGRQILYTVRRVRWRAADDRWSELAVWLRRVEAAEAGDSEQQQRRPKRAAAARRACEAIVREGE